MKTWQAQVGPAGVLPAGIGIPSVACAGDNTNADAACQAALTNNAAIAPCGFGVDNTCDVVFQQQAPGRANALGFEIEACNPVQLTCGGTQALGAPIADPGGSSYGSTLVVEVSAGFTGSANIPFQGLDLDTFFQDSAGTVIPIGKAIPATVEVLLGRCCDDPCTEDVPLGACSNPALWQEGGTCPDNGGPPCAECFVNADCQNLPTDPAGACTTSTCNTQTNLCVHTPIPGYVVGGDNCCNPANAALAPRADEDPCTLDTCTVNDALNLGVPAHNAAPDGTGCDDDNPCTANDDCTGGNCLGDNVNGLACTVDADCQFGGDTPGAVCENSACVCTLEPDLNFVITPGDKEDPNCFNVDDKITVAIHVGPAANIINGGQFAIAYDPACLDFQSASPGGSGPCAEAGFCEGGPRNTLECDDNADCPGGSCNCVIAGNPYTQEIQEIVNEAAGTIFYAVGVALGGEGVAGNVDMAILTFRKLGGCTACDLCFTDVNPLHTYLVDNTGQPVGVSEKCSKEIRQSPTVTIDGPDSVKVNVACNSATGCVSWDAPTVTSDCEDVTLECSGEHLESGCTAGNCCGGTRDGLPCATNANCPLGACMPSVSSGGCHPVGNTNYCCTAVNSCGNSAEHCWTVTVNDATALDVEIQLSPTMKTKPGGGLVRCIKFEVFSNCVQAPLVFEEDVLFGGLFQLIGHFNGAIKIPSQIQPECITARDQLHTLRSCYLFEDGDCDSAGVLHATFKGDPFFGGNWLVGGNLDGWKKDNPNASHDIIDILDFGQIVAQWLENYGSGDTPCGTEGPNADINGDGVVDPLDYSFVSMNFLENSKDCCCPGSASLGNTVGRTEISVAELIRSNMKDLTVADLNNDGMVNLQDMAALMQGVRPIRENQERDSGKGSSGSRSINR
jgi:hypothetical protein